MERKKASSAFIIVAKPVDKKPNIKIVGHDKGEQNAIEMLRKKFEKLVTLPDFQ